MKNPTSLMKSLTNLRLTKKSCSTNSIRTNCCCWNLILKRMMTNWSCLNCSNSNYCCSRLSWKMRKMKTMSLTSPMMSYCWNLRCLKMMNSSPRMSYSKMKSSKLNYSN